MQSYYSNFSCYTGKKQRVSIFGKEKNGKIEIFILTCSKNDEFIKKVAKEVYNVYITEGISTVKDYGYHPEIFLIPKNEIDSVQYIFNQFCLDNFYKKGSHYIMREQDILYKEGEKTINIGKLKII